MSKNNNNGMVLFEDSGIRRELFNDRWHYSITDVVTALIHGPDPKAYWRKLKQRLGEEGSEVVTKCHELKMKATDGKYYLTDSADNETLLRIIQSIPSPKAEPFKMWLAKLGRERIEEIQDPELAVTRAKETYRKKGYDDAWIDKRLRSIHVRNTLTDEWKNRGIKAGNEFGILTDEIYKGTFDMTAKEYKNFKSLDREDNLRDHMQDLELILTMLGEATTTKITQEKGSQGFDELDSDAKTGGAIAGRARKDIDKTIGKKVSTKENFLPKNEDKIGLILKEIEGDIEMSNKKPLDVSKKAHYYDE